MNEKALKWIMYITGAICLYVYIAIRFEPMFNGLLKEKVVDGYWDKTKYGEMYYFSMIRHFREPGMPPAGEKFEHSDKQASLEDARILTFGDSFFEFSRHKQFPERLAEDFSTGVHYVNNEFPLSYLRENNYADTTPRLLIYERTERYIPLSFEQFHSGEVISQPEGSETRGILARVKNKLFYDKSEDLYNIVLKRSYPTTALFSFFSTLKFDLFGAISRLTPAYSKNGPESWLFYYDQVNDEKTSYYYRHSEEEIDNICDNMAQLALDLQEQYNLHLVYLPVPAKYTIHHEVMNNDPYNNFLPSLYKGLEERDVKYIELLDDFLKSEERLYYRTDSHWNQAGIDLTYGRFLEYIQGDSVLNSLLRLI
jgi:hypothetical protein